MTPSTTVQPGAWAARDLAMLAAIFDTFVPGDVEHAHRLARLAAETLDATTDPADVRLLRLALRTLDWPIANLLLAASWASFSRATQERRERILLRWATHRVARLRSAYQAVQRLATFLAYADAGDDETEPANRHWARIGYQPHHRVAAPSPSPAIRPLAVERHGTAPVELDAEAVIVGSGAGGGLIAARLAEAGRAVLVIDAGPYRPEGEMRGLEGAGFRDLFLDRGTTSTADLGIMILAGSTLGGGTTINWTTSIEPPGELRRRWAREHGLTGFDDVETDADLERLRGELRLQPPTSIPPKDRALLDGAAALGWEAAPTERNAGPCTECGPCSFGCPLGAKRSGPRGHLAMAAASGARFLVDAPVERVVLRGGRVTGVEGRLRDGGEGERPFRVRARVVILAAGTLRTPLLLQGSGIAHPQIGRNLRLHPVVAVTGEYEFPVEAWSGPSQAARSFQFFSPGGAASAHPGPAHNGFVIESAPPHPGLTAAAMPWEGGAANLERMARARFLAPFIALLAESGSGQIVRSPRGYPRIAYRLSTVDVATARRALVEMARLARAAGASEISALANPVARWEAVAGPSAFDAFLTRLAQLPASPNRVSLFSAHQLGTARAGADPRANPVDAAGRVRSHASGGIVPGLYVGDASLAPSATVVNPMVTIMALAERTARAVLVDTPALAR